MTTDVDAIIAEATQVATQPEPTETTEVPKEELTGDQEVSEEKDLSQKTDEELTPEQLSKRERNRESKLSKKLAEMKRANRDLQTQLAQRDQPKLQETKLDLSKKPDPNDPTWKDKTWAEFNEALTDWKLENKFSENTKKAQEAQNLQDYTKWVDDRSSKVDERLPELKESIPDIDSVLEEVEDLASMLSPEQARIALEAEDINLAVYTLHKEGKLQDVIKLPPTQLAAAIAKSEIRGQQYLTTPKQISNAPTPLKAAKGNSTGGKSLEKQTVDELMAGYGFR